MKTSSYININSQLDTTITNFIDNYNQLNMLDIKVMNDIRLISRPI